jgi:threonylcarbamoyladenosine tRNA methylthiotransferase MtaB
MEQAGLNEIVITGIHVGAFGRDLDPPTGLAEYIHQALTVTQRTRFRLSSIEPQEITPDIIHVMTQHERTCPHFHIPVQSGDDRILERMGRPYDADLLRKVIRSIRRANDRTCIGIDIMVGFPGEDEASHTRTRALVEELEPAYLHVFPYSPRPGTRAAGFTPHVPEPDVRERVRALRRRSEELRRSFHQRFLGEVLPGTPESAWTADDRTVIVRTGNYIPVEVSFPAGYIPAGTVWVRPERLVDGTVKGNTVASPTVAQLP